ncbi:MAG TPA: hypothetical protein VFS21_19435 [Roseiflexaceae bacterium]|nr:hypothetical protein [Roseiflexaceae bacterium]
MRTFDNVMQDLKLRKVTNSLLGTLYQTSKVPGKEVLLVRHFDNALSSDFVMPYADLIQAAQKWIEQHPELSRLVWIDQPTEVGSDFIARRRHIYHNNTTEAFADNDDPIESPSELNQIYIAWKNAIKQPVNTWDRIIVRVLERSIIIPSNNTYFNYETGQFVVIEPSLTPEDVMQWATLMQVRSFKDIQQSLALVTFAASPLGTLYYNSHAFGRDMLLVRHFDSDLPPKYAIAYSDLIWSIQDWIQQYPDIAQILRIEQPLEVGKDFIARKWHFFNMSNSIGAYNQNKNSIHTPPEFFKLKHSFDQIVSTLNNTQDDIFIRILHKTLFGSSEKAYFYYGTRRFIVAEPMIKPEDVIEWANLLPEGTYRRTPQD